MAQETDTAETAGRFAVGSVIAQSVSVFLRHPLVFASLGILLAVPEAAYTVWYDRWLEAVQKNPGAFFDSKWSFAGIAAVIISVGVVIAIATYAVAEASFTVGLFEQLRGRRVTLVHCLRGSVPALPRLLLLSLLLGGASVLVIGPGILLGIYGPRFLMYGLAVLAIVAVLALSVVWWVVAPAILVEATGPFASFQRSLDLTRGHRWGIFALVMLPNLFGLVGAVVLKLSADNSGWVYAILDHGIDVAIMIASAMFVAVGYTRLRVEQEGFSVQDVAVVFD